MNASDWSLQGKIAVITGGSRGLGLAMAHGLAAAGASIVLASRDGDACRSAAEQIGARFGVDAAGLACHVGHWQELEPFVNEVYRDFGRVDVLVNNAGMSPLYDSVTAISEALFDKVLDVNLKGPFRLSALVGTRMQAAAGGSIINVSSAASLRARPHVLPYAAAKAGLNALTVGLAHTFGPTVRVNAILAGTFATDVSGSWDPETIKARTATFASGRVAQPNEIVGAALYLASAASSYTTGSLLAVDGGQP